MQMVQQLILSSPGLCAPNVTLDVVLRTVDEYALRGRTWVWNTQVAATEEDAALILQRAS